MAHIEFDKEEREQIYRDFNEAVNMTPSELEEWLKTKDSNEVGYKEDDAGESVGHGSGRKIIKFSTRKK